MLWIYAYAVIALSIFCFTSGALFADNHARREWEGWAGIALLAVFWPVVILILISGLVLWLLTAE